MYASKLLWTIVCVALLFTLVLDNAFAMFVVSLAGLAAVLAVLLYRPVSR